MLRIGNYRVYYQDPMKKLYTPIHILVLYNLYKINRQTRYLSCYVHHISTVVK